MRQAWIVHIIVTSLPSLPTRLPNHGAEQNKVLRSIIRAEGTARSIGLLVALQPGVSRHCCTATPTVPLQERWCGPYFDIRKSSRMLIGLKMAALPTASAVLYVRISS